jgi:hypothetical protein
MWFVSRMVSRERENCCDDFVLQCGSEPGCYAESLVRLSELRQQTPIGSREPAGALAAAGKGTSQLRRRVMRILGKTDGPPNMRLTRPGLITFLALIGSCFLPLLLILQTQGGPRREDNRTSGDDKVAQTLLTSDDRNRQPNAESSELYAAMTALSRRWSFHRTGVRWPRPVATRR